MPLDLRRPVAWLFLLLGALLAAYGWFAPQQDVAVDPDLNVNLVWGCVLALFGLVMGPGFRGKRNG